MGRTGLDERYLRTEEARQLVPFARRLVADTMSFSPFLEALPEGESRMLLVLNPQHAYIQGKSAVPGAVQAMDSLSAYIFFNRHEYDLCVLALRSYTADHVSFNQRAEKSPHQVAEAALWPMLKHAVKKGIKRVEELYSDCDAQNEGYSIMKDTHTGMRLSHLIETYHVTHLDVCGLKGDVDVLHTLSDLLEAFPDLRIRCLEKFSPSSDGGEKLSGWLKAKGL